jgi:hypothetical protein
VDAAEHQRDGGHARQHPGRERHGRRRQGQERAGAPEQEGRQQSAGEHGHHADVGADRRRRLGREDAGAGEQQARPARFRGLEGRSERGDGLALGFRVQPGAAGARNQQRAERVAAGGEPGAVPRFDAAFRQPYLSESEEGTGGVGEAEARQQRRGGGAQAVEQGFQLRPERRGFEAFGSRFRESR